jgi:hypothetical protein
LKSTRLESFRESFFDVFQKTEKYPYNVRASPSDPTKTANALGNKAPTEEILSTG